MKVRDLLELDEDVDIYDDYDLRCACALSAPLSLTTAGEIHYSKVLSMDVELKDDTICGVPYRVGIVHTETESDANALKDFVLSAAGYCPESEWYAWFEED